MTAYADLANAAYGVEVNVYHEVKGAENPVGSGGYKGGKPVSSSSSSGGSSGTGRSSTGSKQLWQ